MITAEEARKKQDEYNSIQLELGLIEKQIEEMIKNPNIYETVYIVGNTANSIRIGESLIALGYKVDNLAFGRLRINWSGN